MKFTYAFVAILFCATLQAQVEYYETLPENPEDGSCFVKCIVPDEYSEQSEQVETRAAYKKLRVIPAVYETKVTTVVVRPASKRLIYEPAVYKTVMDTVWMVDPYNQLTVIPATFQNDYISVEVLPKSGSWVAGEKDPNCPSINPADCRIFHYRENPAVVRKVPIEKLGNPASTASKRVEGKYELVAKEVEVTPARTREEIIPEVTKDIKRKVLVKDESVEEIQVPAETVEVTKKVLVKKGGMSAWRKVPCTIPEQVGVVPIHYASNSAALTDKSKKLIDQYILSILKSNSTSIVEIGSHTDSQGGADFNQELSERRAKGVVEYLISKGISANRLIAVGYGETQLLNDCNDSKPCSDSKHAENRRTEFKVY